MTNSISSSSPQSSRIYSSNVASTTTTTTTTGNKAPSSLSSSSSSSYKEVFEKSLDWTNVGLNALDGAAEGLKRYSSSVRTSWPVKSSTQYMMNLSKAKNLSRTSQFLSRGTFGVNAVTGGLDAAFAYERDVAKGDGYYTETMKSYGGTLGSYALGIAAGAAIAGTGMAAAPAVALVVGAGYAGAAIGEQIGSGIVSLRKWWDN